MQLRQANEAKRSAKARKIMKNKNLSSWKYILYVVLFLVTAAATFISMHYQSEIAATVTMTEATLPVVMAKTQAGTNYNAMHGLTCEVDESLINTDLTLLPADKKLGITIDTYGETVTGISYKVRDSRDMSLIENTEVEDFEPSLSRIETVLNIKNLITDEVRYILEITLNTKSHENIYYYTTIVSGVDSGLQEQIDFVLEFNKNTFDPDNLNKIVQYIETKASADNSNFGKVNIYNAQEQIGWGDLNPFVESNIIPSVYNVDGDVAVIALDYTMGAENDSNGFDTYTVHEYYRVRKASTAMYLLDFDRETTQVFDGRNDLLSTGKINLGIAPDTEVEAADDAKNNYTYFENQGNLWCYDKDKNTFTKVFAFESDDSDNVRERYNRHKIRIINVDESGDAQFMVYGYMNRGIHEGGLGISLCSYSYQENETTELLYIPLNLPYEILCDTVGDVAYVSSDRSFYILIGDTLYSVALDSREVMTAVSGLKAGTYQVSSNGRIIAYSTNGELYNTDIIRIYNMENSSDYTITAAPGDKLMALGYIDTDFVYGQAHEQDILEEENGVVTFPMYKLYILNKDYQEIKSYEQEGIYVSGASVDGLRINLTRVVKNGAGYSGASIDQLINKDENNTEQHVSADTISTASRKTEVVLVLPGGAGNIASVSNRSADSVGYKENRTAVFENEIQRINRYYVIGMGLFQGSYDDVSSAIVRAAATYGNVYDSDGNIVWKKYKSSSYMIKGFSAESSYDNSYAAASAAVESFLGGEQELSRLTVKGVALDNILSFVGDGKPVIGKTDDGYAVITAYDSSNVTYIDISTGSEVTLTSENAGKLFTQAGNIFVTYYKK